MNSWDLQNLLLYVGCSVILHLWNKKADELAASEMEVAYGSSNWALLVDG
jgi:hypothetical protein